MSFCSNKNKVMRQLKWVKGRNQTEHRGLMVQTKKRKNHMPLSLMSRIYKPRPQAHVLHQKMESEMISWSDVHCPRSITKYVLKLFFCIWIMLNEKMKAHHVWYVMLFQCSYIPSSYNINSFDCLIILRSLIVLWCFITTWKHYVVTYDHILQWQCNYGKVVKFMLGITKK